MCGRCVWAVCVWYAMARSVMCTCVVQQHCQRATCCAVPLHNGYRENASRLVCTLINTVHLYVLSSYSTGAPHVLTLSPVVEFFSRNPILAFAKRHGGWRMTGVGHHGHQSTSCLCQHVSMCCSETPTAGKPLTGGSATASLHTHPHCTAAVQNPSDALEHVPTRV